MRLRDIVFYFSGRIIAGFTLSIFVTAMSLAITPRNARQVKWLAVLLVTQAVVLAGVQAYNFIRRGPGL